MRGLRSSATNAAPFLILGLERSTTNSARCPDLSAGFAKDAVPDRSRRLMGVTTASHPQLKVRQSPLAGRAPMTANDPKET